MTRVKNILLTTKETTHLIFFLEKRSSKKKQINKNQFLLEMTQTWNILHLLKIYWLLWCFENNIS